MNKYHYLALVFLISLVIEWQAHYLKGVPSILPFILFVSVVIFYLLIPFKK